MSPQVRQLNADDWQIFSALRLQALKECPGNFGSNYDREKLYSAVQWKEKWLENPAGATFGVFNGSELIGITGVTNDREAEATGIMVASYIKPEFRGQGLSDLLYRARLEWAKGYKAWKRLAISHRADNEASRRANQRHGFVFTHRSSKTWPDGVTCDDMHYELDLEQLRKKA